MEKGHRITIHGGTPNQQVYGKKVVTQEKTIYRIPLNDEYILQNKEQDFYVLYGGNKGKEENLYRIIREIYYRKSLALWWIAMHSAAVADRQGRCILLSGEKASGKTTLLCNLLASNKFSLIDNDRLLMGVSRNGMLQAHSMSSTINVGYGTMRICPERFNNLECPTAAMTTDKKRYSRKEFIEQFGCMAIATGIAKSIIFPAIRKDTTRLTKYDAHQTMVKILSAIETFDNNEPPDWLGISNVSEEQYSKNVQIIVKAMIEALPGFELEFGYEKISDSIIDEIEIRGI
ncbi:MAG: hypothetical protein K2N06_12465 [Oscillospiraceae bacterium]|nr:hypothetical protein [Oscillospiraceae bacterium]